MNWKPFHRVSKIIIYPYLYRRELATCSCCLQLSLRFRRCNYWENLNLCKRYEECCYVLSRTTVDFTLLAHFATHQTWKTWLSWKSSASTEYQLLKNEWRVHTTRLSSWVNPKVTRIPEQLCYKTSSASPFLKRANMVNSILLEQ